MQEEPKHTFILEDWHWSGNSVEGVAYGHPTFGTGIRLAITGVTAKPTTGELQTSSGLIKLGRNQADNNWKDVPKWPLC